MAAYRPEPTSCPGCGDAVPARALPTHVCEWGAWLDHQVELRRDELQRFEAQLGDYLDTARGRFEVWYAERARTSAA